MFTFTQVYCPDRSKLNSQQLLIVFSSIMAALSLSGRMTASVQHTFRSEKFVCFTAFIFMYIKIKIQKKKRLSGLIIFGVICKHISFDNVSHVCGRKRNDTYQILSGYADDHLFIFVFVKKKKIQKLWFFSSSLVCLQKKKLTVFHY